MADDFCRPHQHFNKGPDSYTCHHFYPKGGNWICSYCNAERQSMNGRDAGRKYRDRFK